MLQKLIKKLKHKIFNGIDIEALINDPKKFNDFIYTPLEDALKELAKRRKDAGLEKKVMEILNYDLPEPFKVRPRAVIFRQLITPNYEVRRFANLTENLNDELQPLFFEYLEDKLVAQNDWKYSLAKMKFYFGKGKKNGVKIHRTNVIDFNKFNGKRTCDIETLWGESLVDFHHKLFDSNFSQTKSYFFDGSKWLTKNGTSAAKHYKAFLDLFIRDGILFENFMLDQKELQFSRDVFLPAFIEVIKKTGKKPLIVALEPTEIEGDEFWLCHTAETEIEIEKKLALCK